MSRARDNRVRVGSGGRPASGGTSRYGDGLAPMGPSVGGGGSRALRYSPGEEDTFKKEMEKTLRLRRLQQVREQSRRHANEARQEYLQRRDESKRAALRDFRKQSDASRTAEMLTLNKRLQTKLLEVGTAHRLAACTNRVRELEQDRRRDERSKSAERRRTRNLAASKKRTAELMDSKKAVVVAEHRREVWRGEGEEGRIRAREEMMKQESSIAARRARTEVDARRFRQFAGKIGTVQSTHANVIKSGPRIEDFKKSRVHAALVLRHGTTTGARVMGVETTSGNPVEASRRQEAQEKERKEMEEKANSLAEKRGQKALMIEKDRQVVTRQEAELRRVHELDRRRRHTIGAAETNLAAKRRGGVNDGEWPMWWPPPPPHLRPDVGHSTSVGPIAMPVGKPRPVARPSTLPTPQDHEHLRMLQETRQGLLEAAVRAEEQGRGRSASWVGASIGSEGDESKFSFPVPSSGFVSSASAHSVSPAATHATVAVGVVGETTVSSSFASAPPHTSARASQTPSSSDSVPAGDTVSEALPPRTRTPASHVSSRSPPSWQKRPSFVHQGQASDVRRVATAQGHRRTESEKGRRIDISETAVPSRNARLFPKRTMEAVANQQYKEVLMSGERGMLESSSDSYGDGYDGGRHMADASRGEETDGMVHIPPARQEADPGWNADIEAWQVDDSQENTSENVRSPSAALSLQPPPPPMASSSAVASPGVCQQAWPSPSTLGSSPAAAPEVKAVAVHERGSYASVAVQMTPRSYVSIGINTEELPVPERRQNGGARDRAAAEDGRRLVRTDTSVCTNVRRYNSAVQAVSESVSFDGARSSPAVSTPATSDPDRSVMTDRKVETGLVQPVDGQDDALDARYRTSDSISTPPVYTPARGDGSTSCPITVSSSSEASVVQRPPLAPKNLMRNLRETSLESEQRPEGSIGGAPTCDASSSVIAEIESIQTEHTASVLPQLPSPSIPAIREEREDRVRAPWPPQFEQEDDAAFERLERAESQFGERESVTSSSISTLPQLDQELTELLERHRRLDKEASKLTRCAAEDAIQWGRGTSSPGTVDTSYSSLTRDRVTPYRSNSNIRNSVSRVPANETDEKLLQSKNDFSVSEGGDLSSVVLGTYIQHRAEAGSGLSETISSSGDGVRGRGIGGRYPTVVSREHVPAETKPRSRPASPEELGRWREGSVESQSARRLSGQNSGTGVRWDVGVSPRGGVDNAQEVTEWARRIQASIESMNMLVGGFQVARTGTSRASTIDRTVSTPVSASSPRTDTTPLDSGGRRGDSALSKPDFVGTNELQVRSEQRNEVPFVAAPGVESLASAQLGFRKGLRGLLADMASESPGGGEEALRFSPNTTTMATGAGCSLRKSHSSNSGDGRSDIGMSASLESSPLSSAVNEEVKSKEEHSPGDMKPAWKERAAAETQRAGNRMLDVELSQSSSSSTGRRDAASPPTSGASNNDGDREGSLLSSSSASFGGPDLSAEIASIEALGKSLQQRKVRFEPKPDLFVRQQRELEDCRQSILSTTSSSVSRKPSELTESAETDTKKCDVQLRNRREESGSESSTENALAALDAFRAELDAWVAPDTSRDVTTLPSVGGDGSVDISFSDLRDVWSLMGEEKSHARQGSPSQSRSEGDNDGRDTESAMSSKSYDALMQEFLSVDADVIQRARVAIAGHVPQNPAGAAESLMTGGDRGRGLIASSEWCRLGVEGLAGSIEERDDPSQGVLAPVELIEEKDERSNREEKGEKCADQGLRREQHGDAAVKDQPKLWSPSGDRRTVFDAVMEGCATETLVAAPFGRVSPATVTAGTIHPTVNIPPTSAKIDCHGWDDDYRREVSAPYACDRERDTSPTLCSAQDDASDTASKKRVDLEEGGSRNDVKSPLFSALAAFRYQDVDDSKSLDSCGRDESVTGVDVGEMTPSDSGSGIKLDGGVKCSRVSSALLGLMADTSVSDGDQEKTDRSEADRERSEGSSTGVVDRAYSGVDQSDDEDRRERTCEASGSEIHIETSLAHVGDDHERSKADNILDAPLTVQKQTIKPDLFLESSPSDVDVATHGETSSWRSREEFIGEASGNSEVLGTACGDRDEERSAVKEDSSGRAVSSGEALGEDEGFGQAEDKQRDRERLFNENVWDEGRELDEIGGVEEMKENWPPVTNVEATTNLEATLGANEQVGSHSPFSRTSEYMSSSKNVDDSTVDSRSDPINGSGVSDNTDISGGGGAALGLVGSDVEDRSSTMKDMSIKSGDSYGRGFPDVSMIRSEEEVRAGVDDSSYSWGDGCSGTDVDDSGAVGEVQLEHANAEPKCVDEGEGYDSLCDASNRISREHGRLGSSQDVSWSSMGSEKCKASQSLVRSESEIGSERCSMGDGFSTGAQSEEKYDSWISRSQPAQAGSGGGGGKMTHTVDGSLEASEWSSDSMAAGRSRSMDGVSMMPPPKSGVAVAWDLGGPVSVGDSKDGEAGHEGEGDLATAFRRCAPAFIERSQARERELRQRREAREEARVRAATEAKAFAATEASASVTISTSEPCGMHSPSSNEEGRRKQEDVAIRGRSDGTSFEKKLSESAEGDGGRRKVSMKEARKRTARLYNSLPEIVKQREAEERNNQRIRRLLEARENEKQRSRFGKGKRQGGVAGGGSDVGGGT